MLKELVNHTAEPDKIVIIASVTTKGIIFRRDTAMPLTSPTTKPTATMIQQLTIQLPPDLMYMAPSTAPIAMLAGNERSMPPAIMTTVMPMVIRPSSDAWRRMLITF